MIFFTGGSGFVGRHVLRALATQPYSIRALILPGEEIPFTAENIEWVRGDLRQPESLRNILNGILQVVHIAGLVACADEEQNRAVNFEGTRTLVELGKQAGLQRFIFMSAAAVKFKTENAYGRTKKMAEDYLIHSGLPYAILRTPLIIGRGGEEFDRFVDYVDKVPLVNPVFGNGRPIKRPIAIEDVVTAVVNILAQKNAGDKMYEIACRETVTLDQFIDITNACLGKKRFKIHIPLGLSLALALFAEGVMGAKSPVTRDILLGLNEDVDFDIEQSLAELGIEPMSVRDAIQNSI